jgi:hypothetical protein
MTIPVIHFKLSLEETETKRERVLEIALLSLSLSRIVPGTGFEPAHLAAPPPEDGASTNFATRASCRPLIQ